MIDISLVVITKNNPKELKFTLDSLIKQTYTQNCQLIIVNGGKKILYKSIIKLRKTYNLKIIHDIGNGIYKAMNLGAKNAEGNHLIFLNSGDKLKKFNVLKNIKSFNLDKKKGYYFISEVVGKNFKWKVPKNSKKITNLSNVPVHQSILFHKAFYKKKKYSEKYMIASDYDCKINYLKNYNVEFIPYLISVHKLGGISSKYTLVNYKKISYELFSIDLKYKRIKSLILNQVNLFFKFLLYQLNNEKLLELILVNKYKDRGHEIKL